MNRLLMSAITLATVGGVYWYLGSRHGRSTQTALGATTAIVMPGAPNPPAARFNWREVESPDYRTYIANLRAIGCPEETIRDIVIADVNKLFAVRKDTLRDPTPWKYWRSDLRAARLSRAHQSHMLELDTERRALLTTLLGPKAEEELARMESGEDWQRLGFLPEAKRSEVMKIESRFKAERQAIYKEAEEYSSAPDWKRLRGLHARHEAELADLFSTQELCDYQVRNDEVADRLRRNLVGFEPTENEFRELFQLLKAHEERFSFIDPLDRTAQSEAGDDRNRTEEQIKVLLGEERYAQYRRGGDPHFRDLYLLTQQFDLPADIAGMLYDRHRQMQNEISQIQTDPALTAEERDQALRNYQMQINSLLRQSLGDSAYARFQAGSIERYFGN